MSSITNTIFFEKPTTLYVDEDFSVKPPSYATAEELSQSLEEFGPLVAIGHMGPSAYTENSFKLKDKFYSKEIHGWKPDTFKAHSQAVPVILLGIKQAEPKSYIYFTLATDITRDRDSLIRGYRPSTTDKNIYIMSYDNFLVRALVDLHPICPYAQRLYSAPVHAILADKEVENEFRQIGQEIFNHYRELADGNSQAGKSALVRICEAAKFLTQDGSVRKRHIEVSWDTVGDDTCRWFG